MHNAYICLKITGMVNKLAGGASESRGLRMKKSLWSGLDKLAEADHRKTSQYVSLILEKHVTEKSKQHVKEKAGE